MEDEEDFLEEVIVEVIVEVVEDFQEAADEVSSTSPQALCSDPVILNGCTTFHYLRSPTITKHGWLTGG